MSKLRSIAHGMLIALCFVVADLAKFNGFELTGQGLSVVGVIGIIIWILLPGIIEYVRTLTGGLR